MLIDYEELRGVFTDQWGIRLTIETTTQAMRASVQYDTHYMGRNFEDTGKHKQHKRGLRGFGLHQALDQDRVHKSSG